MLQKQGFFSTLFLYRTQVNYFKQYGAANSSEVLAAPCYSLTHFLDQKISIEKVVTMTSPHKKSPLREQRAFGIMSWR
ncbi:hypothetical protein [Acinetobacter sp. ACNIH1]|uniref:hypothetical protein n=1 Tax=Acinetobacter sp. ACNIH1 TaxID=1636603 RepID=UPI000CDC8E35|nr:hypothetical protein [Acinetobacter sp. ACNIH1]AUX88600.1 hypothetical protein C3F22_01285 [Acinetobacter sp. ACNIH1]